MASGKSSGRASRRGRARNTHSLEALGPLPPCPAVPPRSISLSANLGTALVGTGLVLAAIAAPASADWTPLAPFAGAGSIGSPGGTHPITIDGETVHAVYMQRGRLYYRRSTDAGVTWTHPVALTRGGTAQYPCSIELAGGTLHLFWPDSRDNRWEVYHKRSTDGGDTWGRDVALTHGTDLFRMGTAVSGTDLHVVWGTKRLLNKTPGGTHTWGEIYYTRSRDAGLTWTREMRLTEPQATAMRPSVAVSGKHVHVTWFDRRHSKLDWDWDAYARRSTDGGGTWDPDVRMSHTPTHTRHPQVIATGRTVCCIWEDGQVFDGVKTWSGDPALYAAVSTDNGKTWGKPRRITRINAPNGWATHAKSFACGTRIHLAWTDWPERPSGQRATYYMTSPDGGLTWDPPQRLTAPNDGDCWAAGVAGTEAYAIVLVSRGDTLLYRRRKLPATAKR